MKYDIEYYEQLLRKYSKTAEEIVALRWEFIAEVRPKIILDYGSGVGWMRAYRPKDVIVDSYDIGPFPQTGILHEHYDVICFWDVLEHIPDLAIVEKLIRKCDYVATSIPIKPPEKKWKPWKHFRPLEHLHYFDIELLDAMFDYFGFENIKCSQLECPPREDIYDILYKRTA